MKLISCHIENFGKLHDYSIDFSEGANIICEENGWGKSTFAAFVRAMFYGLEGERKRSIEENEVTRYTPWQGGVFGGSLTFEVAGKQYIVTRTFGKTNEFELRDATTNLISNDFSSRLGEEIFKVNRESFMRTVFIGQADCETSSTDAINAKIGALTDNSDDLRNFDTANKRLTEIINGLNPKRVTGSISRRRNEITELERKVTAGNSIPSAIDSIQEKLQAEHKKYEQLKEITEIVREEQVHVLEMEKARERVSTYTMTEIESTELSTLQFVFEKEIPTEASINEMLDTVYKLNSLRKELLIEQLTAQKAKKNPIMLIAGSVIAIGGAVVAGAVSMLPGIIITIVGAILAIVGALTGKNRSAMEQVNTKVAEAEYMRKVANDYLQKFGIYSEEEKFTSDLHELNYKVSRHAYLQEKKQNLQKAIADFEDSKKHLKDEILSLTEINQKLSALADAREASYQLIDEYNDNLENLRQQYDEWEENKLRLEETGRVQDEEQRKYDYVVKAQKYLSEAKESLTARYTTPIFHSFSKYYETITNCSSDQLRIDANTNITVMEQGKQRETNALSSGYRDLIGICLRVALVDAMYADESPVLIMDDPFTNLDDKKMVAAKEFLKQVSEKYQVIYFTCSDSRS